MRDGSQVVESSFWYRRDVVAVERTKNKKNTQIMVPATITTIANPYYLGITHISRSDLSPASAFRCTHCNLL